MSDFKLVRRDVCDMCQTSKKELEALREVAAAAINLWRQGPEFSELEEALDKLEEARRG